VTTLPATVAPTDESEDVSRTLETIDIRGPAGFDLEALNETIRQGLPEGVEMHVVGDPEGRH
jgi:hypothetical protein